MAVAGGASGPTSSASSDSKDDAVTAVTAVNAQIQQLFDMLDKRTKVTEIHLDSLDKLLVPSMPLRFLEWVMTQNDKFYTESTGLWNCLWRQTLSLTPTQMSSLLALRSEITTQRAAEAQVRAQALNMTGLSIAVPGSASVAATTCSSSVATPSTATLSTTSNAIAPCVSMSSTLSLQAAYSQLSALSRLHMANSQRNLAALHSILTPLQIARFFEWVNFYGHICVQINL